ncbi:MurR/RpiR family transcriptional regulator [Bordetella sp. N]|uniref:MurR/RpiR family transcriptional regulator n=1 Tax=Bordetella sp. N TaxID=1746199 RepID=UPI0009E7C26F|nr:MurR/RpiR family transcriptional regulator [Bordetella sp. N]
MSLTQQITSCLDQLTPAQQNLARYLLDHREQVAFMTARALAEAVGQSDAAVVRFARAVGYAGYPQLREALRGSLLERAGALGMRKAPPSSAEALKNDIFDTDAALIAETARLNSTDTALAIADLLIGARRVWVTGHGTSYPLAAYLAMHLNQVMDKVQVFNVEHGDLADRFRTVGEGDVFIGIGYVRYLPYTVDILQLARDNGAQVVAITDRPTSPLARLAAHTLYAARGMNAFAWWTQTGTMTLANWITAMIMARDAERVTDHLRHSDAAWKQLGHWRSSGNNDSEPSLEQHLLAGMQGRRKRTSDKS